MKNNETRDDSNAVELVDELEPYKCLRTAEKVLSGLSTQDIDDLVDPATLREIGEILHVIAEYANLTASFRESEERGDRKKCSELTAVQNLVYARLPEWARKS